MKDKPSQFSRSLSHRLDFRRHGVRRCARMAGADGGAVSQSLQHRHNLDSDRGRADRDDVSALHQGALRRAARGLSQQESAWAVAGAELGGRSHPYVRAGRGVPARLSGVHGRADHDWAGALHRHGHRVERAGEGRHRIRGRTGGLQFALSGLLLLALRLDLHHRSSRASRAEGLGGQRLHRRDCQERLHLSRHPFPRGLPDAHRCWSGRRDGSGTTTTSCPASARSR